MTRVSRFLNDRGRIAAIDYAFVALLACAARELALRYGALASPIIRHALHLG